MKRIFLVVFAAFLALAAFSAPPQEANQPLGKDQVLDLVKFGMDSTELAKRIKDHGIDFEPTDDYLETLRKAGAQDPVIQALREIKPKPLTRVQVGELVAGGVPSERAVMLVKQHGIDFLADERYLQTLRVAGADETLLASLREASKAVTAELVVATSPGADVYLDGALQGRADSHGELTAKLGPGIYTLKISQTGKKDFEQSVTLVARQATIIDAGLEAMKAELVVETSPDALVFLDEQLQGKAGAQGELATKAGLGVHRLRVTMEGKKDFDQSITLARPEGTKIAANLEDLDPAKPADSTSVPAFGNLPKIWHSEVTKHDFRVQVTNDLFRAEWVNIPPAVAKQGAYIHTECRRAGSKWEGSSSINMAFAVAGASPGKDTKMCTLSVRFEVDCVTADKITGHSEALHSFDVNTCRVQETKWGEFTWVPKK